MLNTRQILIISLLIVFILPTTLSFSQQSNIQSDIDFLNKEVERFLSYQQDFLAFEKSQFHHNANEVDIAASLYRYAAQAYYYLDALYVLLSVYKELSCEADRAAARPLIKRQLDYYPKQLDFEMKEINIYLADTKVPVIAVSGTKMKEDLREIKSRLESINLQ